MLLPPVVPVLVPEQVPPNVPFASVMFAGKLSTNALVNVAIDALLLLKVMVNVLVPPGAIVEGLNALETVGPLDSPTVRVAFASLALLPKSVRKSPATIVFIELPVVLEVTVAVMVQLPFAGIVPPLA